MFNIIASTDDANSFEVGRWGSYQGRTFSRGGAQNLYASVRYLTTGKNSHEHLEIFSTVLEGQYRSKLSA